MSEQLTPDLPKESDSQRIGRLAAKCFEANSPISWTSKSLDGDADFGYDYQIQILDDGLAKDVFRMQLKGTLSPILIADGTAFSISIKLSTANYYARAIEPILLIYCDLTTDPEIPKNCSLYYAWIHDDLDRLRKSGIRDGQQSITLHVPKSNALLPTTNLSPDIARFRQLSKLGHSLDDLMEEEKPNLDPSERVGVATKIISNLNSKSTVLIDALAEDLNTSWVEAPHGTLPWYLKEATAALRNGQIQECHAFIDSAKCLLENAKTLEHADFWNIVGRLRTYHLDFKGATEAFATASELSTDNDRHLIPWAESVLRNNQQNADGHVENLSPVIERIKSNSPVAIGMRARLIASTGNFDLATKTTESLSGTQRFTSRALIFSMQGKWEETLAECESGLKESVLDQPSKLIYLMLRARSRYSIAIGPINFKINKDVYLPAPGPAGSDVSLLHLAWKDVIDAVTILRNSGWPSNIDLIADMWTSIAIMLGFQKKALPLISEAARIRPDLLYLQSSLATMAVHSANFEIALEANSRLPETAMVLHQRIIILHANKKHLDCVKLLQEKWSIAADDSKLFGFALLHAIHSAKKVIQPALAMQWQKELESKPEFSGQVAVYNFYEKVKDRPLERDHAISELIETYKNLNKPPLIAKHIFIELDNLDPVQATLSLELIEVIKAHSLLEIVDFVQYAQALSTLNKWEELLELADEGINQFRDNSKLLAIKAIALDKLGNTSEAHDLLKELIERPYVDKLALLSYIKIVERLGFVEQALQAVEKIFNDELDQTKKFEPLHHLYALVYQSNPTDPRLGEIAWQMGEVADPTNELQEGKFLMSLMTATLLANYQLSEERSQIYKKRLEAFTEKYPNSDIFRSYKYSNEDPADELIRQFQDATGTTEEKLAIREKMQREIAQGSYPLPYAWRPLNLRDPITDVAMLWEVSKSSSWGARHLHLVMALDDWKEPKLQDLRGQIPLLDLISLLVLSDLNLLDLLFKAFPTIAVGKATLNELQKLISPIFGSQYRDKLLIIQNKLKEKFRNVSQPESIPASDDQINHPNWSSLEIIQIAKSDKYLIYSDDALIRSHFTRKCCTLDLLSILEALDLITVREAAEKVATLSAWRVSVMIPERYQLAILPEELGSIKNITEGTELIGSDELSRSLYNSIWTLELPFKDLLSHAGLIVRNLAENSQNSILTIASLAGYWIKKVQYHRHALGPADNLAAAIIVQAALYHKNLTQQPAIRLWDIYHNLVEHNHGVFMDDEKYRKSFMIIAGFAAELDNEDQISGAKTLKAKLSQGLTEGTNDADLFIREYNVKIFSLATAKLKQ
jgi:tetratricopeptide (TPR) repeat protein